MMRLRPLIPVLSLVLAAATVLAAAAESPVVTRVREAFAKVQDYHVKVFVHVDLEGFEIPDQIVDVYFKRPDRVLLEGPMPGLLPRENIVTNPAQLFDEGRYLIREAGSEVLDGRKVRRLHLYLKDFLPEEGEPAGPDLVAWVDPERWVVVRMEAFAGEKTQGIVNIDYGRVKGAGWLPEKTRIDIFLDAPPAAASAPGDSTRPRLPEKGVIDLVFHEYEVNVGLPDSLFEEVSP